MAYSFNQYLNLHMVQDDVMFSYEVPDSSGKLQFIGKSQLYSRYAFGPTTGILATGKYKFVSYGAAVYNSLSSTFYTSNSNTELAYVGRADFAIMGKYAAGMSDVDNTQSPALVLGAGGLFGYYEGTAADPTQSRVIAGTADARFKYKGLSMFGAAVYRQTDKDQFTQAQTDMGFVGQVGYFIIPQHFEIAARVSALIDDMTNAGLNIHMNSGLDTRLDSPLNGGDVNGDSSNEWEYTLGLNYYFKGHFAKIQGQYTFFLDGMTGSDDRVSHIGMVQAQLAF